jgi:hypothetical protein
MIYFKQAPLQVNYIYTAQPVQLELRSAQDLILLEIHPL